MASPNHSVRPILDHIVILVSYDDLQEIPHRLKDSLTVIDGGTHADGVTLNKLIIFADGTYIEIIAFQKGVDPNKRKQHRWGLLEEGSIVAYAHTLPEEGQFSIIQKRVADEGVGVTYRDPVSGGRIRPDGVELKWAVASVHGPDGAPLQPGVAPFWCLDRTPRELRVPYQGEDKAYTTHPSGARGVSKLRVEIPEADLSVLGKVYQGIHGSDSSSATDESSWGFLVHSGLQEGAHKVSLRPGKEGRPHIALTLLGNKDSPKSVELLPGVIATFE